MEEVKYYNLLECLEIDIIFEYLDDLTLEGKIEYVYDDVESVVKITDYELSDREVSEMSKKFEEYDVIEDKDYKDMDDDSKKDFDEDFLENDDEYDF